MKLTARGRSLSATFRHLGRENNVVGLLKRAIKEFTEPCPPGFERARWSRLGCKSLVIGVRIDSALGRYGAFERLVGESMPAIEDHVVARLEQVRDAILAGRLGEASCVLAPVAALALREERRLDAIERAERELTRAVRRQQGLCERCGEVEASGQCRACLQEQD